MLDAYLVESLCSDRCEGRAAGTPGGIAAREEVVAALRNAGLDPFEQPIAGCRGANVIAPRAGDEDRWVVVAAHYDHLGRSGSDIYRGADDNAAAVAILVDIASTFAKARPRGRGVLFAAFDAEEPPYFLSDAMGSEHFARHPSVALDKIDMMVCMDLVAHAIGGKGVPETVANSVLALGAERSAGTIDIVDGLASAVPGVHVRRVDAGVIPPLSDYDPFWRRDIPFLFLTSGRSRRYHTPEDTPEHLDYAKMAATARWLEGFVRAVCESPEPRIAFLPWRRRTLSPSNAIVLENSAKIGRKAGKSSRGASIGQGHSAIAGTRGRQFEDKRARGKRPHAASRGERRLVALEAPIGPPRLAVASHRPSSPRLRTGLLWELAMEGKVRDVSARGLDMLSSALCIAGFLSIFQAWIWGLWLSLAAIASGVCASRRMRWRLLVVDSSGQVRFDEQSIDLAKAVRLSVIYGAKSGELKITRSDGSTRTLEWHDPGSLEDLLSTISVKPQAYRFDVRPTRLIPKIALGATVVVALYFGLIIWLPTRLPIVLVFPWLELFVLTFLGALGFIGVALLSSTVTFNPDHLLIRSGMLQKELPLVDIESLATTDRGVCIQLRGKPSVDIVMRSENAKRLLRAWKASLPPQRG